MDEKKEKLKEYLHQKLLDCKKELKKYKRKKKMIKILFYSIITTSIVESSAASIISTLPVSAIAVTCLSGASCILTALSTRFNLEKEKDNIQKKIKELNELKNTIQYVEASNGNLTEEIINNIYSNI